jgi:hypothetical protein
VCVAFSSQKIQSILHGSGSDPLGSPLSVICEAMASPAMSTPLAALESAVQLNAGNLLTFTIDVNKRIDKLEVLMGTAQAAINEHNTKLEDRIEISFVHRDQQSAAMFESVVNTAEQRLRLAVEHGEQRLQAAALQLQQEAQHAAKHLDDRVTSVCESTASEFVKNREESDKGNQT